MSPGLPDPPPRAHFTALRVLHAPASPSALTGTLPTQSHISWGTQLWERQPMGFPFDWRSPRNLGCYPFTKGKRLAFAQAVYVLDAPQLPCNGILASLLAVHICVPATRPCKERHGPPRTPVPLLNCERAYRPLWARHRSAICGDVSTVNWLLTSGGLETRKDDRVHRSPCC